MAYNRSHARQICSPDEYKLFLKSTKDGMKNLSPKDLKNTIDRTRKVRDKYQDLYRRQSIEIARTSGTKRGRSNQANKRTEQKVKLFNEALERLGSR